VIIKHNGDEPPKKKYIYGVISSLPDGGAITP